MRVVVDEDLPRSLAPLFREKGYEVYDVRDVGLRGHSDEEIFKFAQSKNAVIFTADLGFADITKFPLSSHNGIVILRFPNELTVNAMLKMISPMIDEIATEDLRRSIVVFSPHRIRMRSGNE
ncbi:hypothetical protein A3G55_01720 [Candidatus Giovannonibacteria bacterium RIFCSPLOWO2_12_FULL_44_25]|uniref:DUF5615 domain-containing protein n=3 Tax=Parcubacteria group TaxID=1794811 RepID=A0A837IK47_9BACT|nr:MAG: hypothetical protein UW15_C0004G0029 [Parcubacteria group bacterium GW2011_GWC1_44_10]KKT60164.1 MAG: hypothetical protein UW53_C0003G0075 [Candidatus Giovannonibacteria bacterium GW2011_GWA1_44_25]KKU12371.1 MAG: hypothetical protein UX18_C0025G0005 [Candidatus Azambacteria bacterium GW2011_GWC2_45_7b]KKU30011.1 MAG: hypothetical protein UX43_C0003G0104 [Candidatus Giovannonibacteria bacterium GW2011_GWB1_46_20]OGF49368.1 MAG: hypothetical protein A2120_03555 [Candidatus Giovannonibact